MTFKLHLKSLFETGDYNYSNNSLTVRKIFQKEEIAILFTYTPGKQTSSAITLSVKFFFCNSTSRYLHREHSNQFTMLRALKEKKKKRLYRFCWFVQP